MTTLPQSGAARGVHERRAWRVGLLVAATLLAGVLSSVVQWPLAAAEPLFAAVNVLVTVAFFVNGMVLARVPGQSGTAFALVMLALLYAVGWLNWWESGPLPLAAEVLGPLAMPFGAWAVLRYPDSRLRDGIDRGYVLAAFVWLPGAQALLVPISRPAWHHFDAAVWWPELWPLADLYSAGHRVYESVTAGLAAAFVVLLLVRLAARARLDRHLSAPVAAASVAAAAAIAMQAVGLGAGLARPAMHVVFTVSGFVLLLIPVGFLAAAVRSRLARSAVADLVVRLARPDSGRPDPDAFLTELQEVLCDPTLELVYEGTGARTVTDARDRALAFPTGSSERLVVPVDTHDGDLLAVILADPALARHRELLDAAIAACGLAMQRARLEAVLRDSRAHLLAASSAGHRQVERDLHDGAQQRLLALAAKLAAARLAASDERTAAAMDHASSELRTAIEELRRLARGIHPGVLTEAGLAAAVDDVAEGLPLPVRVDLDVGRLDPRAETAAYFVICEALANVVKHAAAGSVTVRGRLASGMLEVEVADDGVGGANPRGGGLSGLADRVHGLGGRLTVVSPTGGGTRVEMRLPCG